jgi:sugar phosphate isomerase/epimerase
MAAEHVRRGFGAAFCPRVALTDFARVGAIRDAFSSRGLVIAEVGAWCNMKDPDPTKRRVNLEYVVSQLALADEIGAVCCVNVAGSFHPTSRRGPHPDDFRQVGFDATVEAVRHVIDAAAPRRARFAIELTAFAYPNSPETYLRLVQAVDRPAFGVHLDPVNIVNSPEKYFDSGRLIRQCFDTLGKWVVGCHAKDVVIRDTVVMHVDEVRAGLGALDYRAFLTELSRLHVDAPLMIEHLPSNEEYALAAEYIRGVARSLALGFV